MEKKLLFIDDSNSFITKSIMATLKAAGIESEMTTLSVKNLSDRKDMIAGYIFFNITDMNSINDMAITYLRDMCLEHNYMLYFMGYEEDIATLKSKVFAEGQVGEFHRPINAKQVAEQIIARVSEKPEGMNKKHILVVDDSGTMLTTIQSWLGSKYRVSMVNSAMNAFNFLAKQTPDLILLDYDMPVCTGAQFLEMLRNDVKTESIPVIFLTGKGDKESVKSVLALKPAGYLLKSMPKENIIADVDAFFEKQKM